MKDENRTNLQQTDGTPLTERQIRRGLRVNIFAGATGMMWAAVALGMPLTMFMESIKASGVLIGLSATVQQLATLVQLPAAFVSEWLSSRKQYWFISAFVHRACWLFVPFLPYALADHADAMAATVVAIVAISSVLGQASAASWWSWMTDLVPDRLRNRFWSTRQSMVFTSYLVAMGAAGYVLDYFPDPGQAGGTFLGFAIVFGAAALLGCSDIVIHMGVPEPRPSPPRRDRNILQRLLAPWRNSDFRALTLAMGAWAFSVGLIGPFGMLYMKREFGISYTGITATVVSATLGTILASLMWAYVMDRISARNFGIITMILAPACGLAWFFATPGLVTIPVPFAADWRVPQAVLVLTASSFIAGAVYSGVGLAQSSLLGAVCPREGRTVAMAVHFSVIGLMAAVGPVLGGLVVDHFGELGVTARTPSGPRFGFVHALVVLHLATTWLLAAPLLTRIRRRSGEVGLRTAVSRFLIVNPFRMISSIANIHAMGVSETRHDRADAIRRLGEEKTAIATTDLIEELDSPSIEVREEAALALGRIAAPEGVQAMVKRLADPNTDMAPELARALRLARDPVSVQPLLDRLAVEKERAAVIEIVRTLGTIGDKRANETLLHLFRTTDDPKTMVACSEALARLNCFAAVYEVPPRMKAGSADVRRALTVNLGDLLGTPGGFYRTFTREQRLRGSETEEVLAGIVSAIRHVVGVRGRTGAEGAVLVSLIERLDEAYLGGKTDEAVRLLHDTVLNIAKLDYGVEYTGDLMSFVEALVWQDERFAVGTWFLGLLLENLNDPSKANPDDTDVLLGIHFLSGWANKYT
jgi:MFS family permease